MKMLELFSGSKQMATAFKNRGWDVFTVDFDPDLMPDLVADIGCLSPDQIIERFGRPDVIWSSPPCQAFSVAGLWKYRPDGVDSPERLAAIELHKHAVDLVLALKPKYFFIENPRGTLRHQNFMRAFKRYTITYCQYGFEYMKPTDIWTNHPRPEFKHPCKPNDKCHGYVPHEGRDKYGRRLKVGLDHTRDPYLRSIVPEALCDHVASICELDIPVKNIRQAVLS